MHPGFILISLFICSCAPRHHVDLDLSRLSAAKAEYDEYIIKRALGLHRLGGIAETDSSYGIIAVHGFYPSNWSTKGWEWVAPLKELGQQGVPVWFFRYDWNACPKKSAAFLQGTLTQLFATQPHLDSLWLVGHSLGGKVVALLAENWSLAQPVTIHAVAAALAGINSFQLGCPHSERTVYTISPIVRFIQWQTVHKQDGAFKDMPQDPQNVRLTTGRQIRLPESWESWRLGHNRALLYVCSGL